MEHILFYKMNWFSLIKLFSKSHFLLPSSPLCLLVFLFYPLQIFQHLKYEYQTVSRSLLLILAVPYSYPYFLLSSKSSSFSCCSFEMWMLLICHEPQLVLISDGCWPAACPILQTGAVFPVPDNMVMLGPGHALSGIMYGVFQITLFGHHGLLSTAASSLTS